MKPFILKKRPRQEDDNDWSLTLADMMTLLLCFFVLLITVANVDKHKYETMSSVLAEAMGGDEAPSKKETVLPAEVRSRVESKNLFELQLELADLIGEDRNSVELSMRADPHAVAISLKDAILFDLGSADLRPAAKSLLNRMAKPLTNTGYTLIIEGHTDNLPINSPRFPSNWELSSARASAVARHFIDQGFPPCNIQVTGLADTRPVAPNTDESGNSISENQSKNRRVVILVHPVE